MADKGALCALRATRHLNAYSSCVLSIKWNGPQPHDSTVVNGADTTKKRTLSPWHTLPDWPNGWKPNKVWWIPLMSIFYSLNIWRIRSRSIPCPVDVQQNVLFHFTPEQQRTRISFVRFCLLYQSGNVWQGFYRNARGLMQDNSRVVIGLGNICESQKIMNIQVR